MTDTNAVQHLTEVLTDGPVTPGTVAHRRKLAVRPKDPNTRVPYDGTPTSRWPACMPKPGDAEPGRWHELSAGRAFSLGTVP